MALTSPDHSFTSSSDNSCDRRLEADRTLKIFSHQSVSGICRFYITNPDSKRMELSIRVLPVANSNYEQTCRSQSSLTFAEGFGTKNVSISGNAIYFSYSADVQLLANDPSGHCLRFNMRYRAIGESDSLFSSRKSQVDSPNVTLN